MLLAFCHEKEIAGECGMNNLFVDKTSLKEKTLGEKKRIDEAPRVPYQVQRQKYGLPKNRYC